MVPKDHTSSKVVSTKVMVKIDLNIGIQDGIESAREPVDQGSILGKVLATVYGQIQFTTLLIALFVFVETVKAFVLEQKDLFSFLLYIWAALHVTILFTKERFGSINFRKYTLGIVYTAILSCFVAIFCLVTKINTILLAAGITTEIFFFLLVICLFAKIGDRIWFLISLVAAVGVIIFGLIVLILTLSGSLYDKEFVIISSFFLSFFILLVLIDFHEILGIGWFKNREATNDLCLYSSLVLHRNVLCTFIFLVILLDEDMRKG